RVDPEDGAGESGVAERADGIELAARPRVAGVEIEAAGALDRHVGRRLVTGQHMDYLGLEDRRAAAKEHARVAGQVLRGGEEAGVAGHAAHAAGGGVVDDASQHHTSLVRLSGRDAGWLLAVGRWPKGGVLHAQRG